MLLLPGRCRVSWEEERRSSSERLIDPLGTSGRLLGKRVLSGAVGLSSTLTVEKYNFKYDCFYFNSFCSTKNVMNYFLVLLIIPFLILFIKTQQNRDFRESEETIHRHWINFYVILYLKISLLFLKIKYSWPLNNVVVRGTSPTQSKMHV